MSNRRRVFPTKNRFFQLLSHVVFASFFTFIFSQSHHVLSSTIKFTQEEIEWIAQYKVVTVAGEPDWAPFDFVNASGRFSGVSWDYLRRVSELSGLEFDVEVAPWHENLTKVMNNEADLMPASFMTEERQEFLLFSTPYYETLEYFFIRSDLSADSVDDLNGLTVAIPKDYAHIEFVRESYPRINLLLVDTVGDAIDAVIEQQADLLYETFVTVEYLLNKDGIQNIKPLLSGRNKNSQTLHVAVRKSLPLLHSIINKSLAAITDEERLTIEERWLSRKTARSDLGVKFSKQELQWIESSPILRFAGDPSWLPYEGFDDQGQYIGIVSDYLKLIEERTGLQFEPVQTATWVESVELAKAGKVDVISETFNSPLDEYVDFTKSYLSSPIVIVMREDTAYVENIEQIKTKRIALIKEYGYVEEIINAYPSIPFFEVNDIEEGLTRVVSGGVDAILMTLAQASYYMSSLGISNVRIVGKTEFQTRLSFGVNKDMRELVPILNKAIDSVSFSDRQSVVDSWGSEKFVEKTNYAFATRVVIASLFVLILTLLWNRKLAKEVMLRKEAQDQLQKIINIMPAQVFVTDLNGVLIRGNAQFINDFELKESELEDFCVDDLYVDFSDKKDIVDKLTREGVVRNKVIRLCRKGTDSIHSLMLSVIPIRYLNKSALLATAVDLNERLEIEEELRSAKDAAEIATRSKSEFLANMSHEIRTPMNAIVGFTELLEMNVKDDKLLSYVKTIKSSSNNLLLIVNDILDLSKIESGSTQIEKTPAKPKVLFDELYNIFKLSIRDKGLRMMFDIHPDIPEVLLLDIKRLRQVLINLIGNAIKFTDSGYVRLLVGIDNYDETESKLNLKIDVEDTGVGIPEKEVGSVFDKFHQAKLGYGDDRGGTGLGLSISHRLVSLMGGNLSVTSTVGKGTTLTVHLKGVDIVSVVDEDVVRDLTLPQDDVYFHRATVLVVDDIKVNRTLVAEVLEEKGLTVLEAENGAVALDMIGQGSVDLVLMDLRMPVMDGYKATEIIKGRPIDSSPPVVALTASVMSSELNRIGTSLFDGYLRKPVSSVELVRKLAGFLKHQRVSPVAGEAVLDVETKSMPTQLRQELLALHSVYLQTLEDNNLKDLENFALKIKSLAEENEYGPLVSLTQSLLGEIKNFNITGVNGCLKQLGRYFIKAQ